MGIQVGNFNSQALTMEEKLQIAIKALEKITNSNDKTYTAFQALYQIVPDAPKLYKIK